MHCGALPQLCVVCARAWVLTPCHVLSAPPTHSTVTPPVESAKRVFEAIGPDFDCECKPQRVPVHSCSTSCPPPLVCVTCTDLTPNRPRTCATHIIPACKRSAADKECTDHHYCPFCQLYCKSPCKVAFTHAAKCLDLTAKQYRDEVCAIWWKKLLDCEVDNMEYFHKVAQEMKAEKAAKEEDKQ